jgi:hypothetical protein
MARAPRACGWTGSRRRRHDCSCGGMTPIAKA